MSHTSNFFFILLGLCAFTSQEKCRLSVQNATYDLNKLRLTNGRFWSLLGANKSAFPYTHVILSVCAPLNITVADLTQYSDATYQILKIMRQKCPPNAAICALNSLTGEITSLGTFSSDLAMTNFAQNKDNLRLVYTNGDECDSGRKNKTTNINFICDRNANSYVGLDLPRLTRVSADKCEYEIYWRSLEACPKQSYSSRTCRIDGFFDLNKLASENALFEAQHNHDLDAEMGAESSEEFTLSSKYAFQICGKRLRTLSHENLTFWDMKESEDSFQFSQVPDLVYEEGMLYFKYVNATANKRAFIKMECSYEESISSNSNEFRLMFDDRLDFPSNSDENLGKRSAVAFVLWKTRHACLRGSNELSAHFLSEDSSCCMVPDPSRTLFSVAKDTRLLDLRILLKKHQADEKDLVVTVPGLGQSSKFFTRLCAHSLKCASKNSYGCLKLNETSWLSLGSALSQKELVDQNLRLLFEQGDFCAQKANYSFEVLLKCWPNQEHYLTFIRRSQDGCRFHFEWLTSQVCSKVTRLGQNCQLKKPDIDNDADLSNTFEYFTYDFGQLKRTLYETTDKLKTYQIGVCRTLKPNECGLAPDFNVSICSNKTTNEGIFSDTLSDENGLISLTYPSMGAHLSSTRIEFFCEYNEENLEKVQSLYYLESESRNVLGMFTYLACPPYLSRQNIDFKCFVSFPSRLDTKVNTVAPLQSFFSSQKSAYFTFRFKQYRLIFRICGMLPSVNAIQNSCYDKYGNARGSACLFDDLNAKQFNLGVSKGPFIASYTDITMTHFGQTNTTFYTLSYTQGDLCVSSADTNTTNEKRMQLILLFKCAKNSWLSTERANDRMDLIDVGDHCKVNVQVEMEAFCTKIDEFKDG